jgi:hypothetical protein
MVVIGVVLVMVETVYDVVLVDLVVVDVEQHLATGQQASESTTRLV